MDESRNSQFSVCGNFLAHVTRGGVLKIWDAHTGQLHQDYTPSAHLASLGTCLRWAPIRTRTSTVRKRKKKEVGDGAAEAVETLTLIAWGTETGDAFLYSFAEASLRNKLTGRHSGRVNDLCWSRDGTRLYSCGEDGVIAQWDVVDGKIVASWKGDKRPVVSLSISADGNFIISAARKIKFWDAKTHELLQTFTGHSTQVNRLLFIHPPSVENKGNLASRPYFVSAARDDRVINIWQHNPDVKGAGAVTTSALVSMTIPEEPQDLSLKQPESIGEPILISVVSKAGLLHVFQHRLNGPMQKPLNPKVTINVVEASDSSTLAVLTSLVRVDKEILFCYGSFLRPAFDRVPYDPTTPHVTLQRHHRPSPMTPNSTDAAPDVHGVRKPEFGDKVKVLGPGSLSVTPKATRKRKISEKTEEVSETRCFAEILSMESRDNKASTTRQTGAPSQIGVIPKPKEKSLLLTQGLVSKDVTIINSVMQESNDVIIRNTLNSLAIDYVDPLLDVIASRIMTHSNSALNAARWLKWLLKQRAGFLLTRPDSLRRIAGLRQSMEARADTLARASKLQGRLELVLAQVRLRKERASDDSGRVGVEPTTAMAARFAFEEDSDDDEPRDENELMKDSESDQDEVVGGWIDISAPASPVGSEEELEVDNLEEGGRDIESEGADKNGDVLGDDDVDDEDMDERDSSSEEDG